MAVELDLPEANDVVIDCDVFVGLDAGSGVAGGRSLTATDLVSEMDRVGVTTAVVYHVVAREHAPMLGNKLLLAEIRDHPRLIPAFIMLPTHTGEQPPLAELMAQIKEQGVRLARMFPASDLAGHRFAFREWCVGDVLSALESANIPLMLDFSLFRRGEPPWDDIYETYRLHPDLQLAWPMSRAATTATCTRCSTGSRTFDSAVPDSTFTPASKTSATGSARNGFCSAQVHRSGPWGPPNST